MKNTFHFNVSTADDLGIGIFKYSFSPKEKFIIINSTLAHMLGYSSKTELKKEKFTNLFSNSESKKEFFKVLESKTKIKFFETLFKRKRAKPLWVAITASKLISRDKKEYIEGIVEDISSHKKMERKLALERKFLQGLLDNIPDAIYFKDHKNRIIKVNKFYAEGAKLKSEEIVGKTDFDFFPKRQARQMFKDDNHVLRTGKSIVGKIEHNPLADGTFSQVMTTKIPMYDEAGKIIGTMGVTRDMTAYANLEKERVGMLINGLAVLGKVLEMRDPYTANHNQNVAYIAERITKVLKWDENRILGMRLAGELHDLGKIGIPLDILNKPGKLSNLEYRLIQEHVPNCYGIVKDMKFPFSLAKTIYQHHERLDGTGYPEGLKADKIILEARILAVSDVLESMTSYRPYRQALGINRALQELKEGSGSKYDPKIVKIVIDIVKENKGKAFWIA